ncbi:MAG: TIGR01244 family phosphatase, partial [Alphaproteobacteria bacterium]|nr:TIGR01244 family phosphatase [Alphaproteobacteria bacterium]
MFSPTPISGTVWAAPQIAVDDTAAALALGARWIVNNRPDGEEPGQPSSAEMEQACRDSGLGYVHAPVSGLPDAQAVASVARVLESNEPALLYCRSGMRSAAVWAMAMRSLDRAGPDELRAA